MLIVFIKICFFWKFWLYCYIKFINVYLVEMEDNNVWLMLFYVKLNRCNFVFILYNFIFFKGESCFFEMILLIILIFDE